MNTEHKGSLDVLVSFHRQAWAEVNTRIASRQATQVAFAAAVFSVLGLVAVLFSSQRYDTSQLFLALSVSSALVSWVYLGWILHNEAILGILTNYCRLAEYRINQICDIQMQGWFSGLWIKESLRPRQLSDIAMALLHLATTAPSLCYLASYRGMEPIAHEGLHMFLVVLSCVPAIVVLLVKWLLRRPRSIEELVEKYGNEITVAASDSREG